VIDLIYEFLLFLIPEGNSIERDPKMIITEWAIFDVIFSDGSQSSHLVGHVLVKGDRVSTEITDFFPETKTIITNSDRKYKLVGGSRTNSDGEFWEQWKNLYNVVSYKDITNEYTQRIKAIFN